MTNKHTPGDWFVADVSRKGAAVFSDAEEIVYCAAYDKHDIRNIIAPQKPISSEEAHANARLIAAAPDMLEALKLIQNQDLVLPADRKIIKSAIAKAIGER